MEQTFLKCQEKERGAQTVSLSITMRHLAAQTAVQTTSSETTVGAGRISAFITTTEGGKQTNLHPDHSALIWR